jgi:hypothetical protein
MKAVVLRPFRDKHTGAAYAPGEVLTIDRERFSSIRETLGDSYIAEIVDPEAAPMQDEPDSGRAPQPEPDSGDIPQPEPDSGDIPQPEPDSGGEVPADVDPAPPEPPPKKGRKKE